MTTAQDQLAEIKQIPEERLHREAIRSRAAGLMPAALPLERGPLEAQARDLLQHLRLPHTYLGFAMVAISNAVWRAHFAAVPFHRRLLLLPRCLSDTSCAGHADGEGLQCAGCGACDLQGLTAAARALGYQVMIAEGTSTALAQILEGRADAILGVACLDSLEKSFTRIADLGIPHLAVPLLTDGCAETEAESEEILAVLRLTGTAQGEAPRSCLPLLRETARIFTATSLSALLAPARAGDDLVSPLRATDEIAFDWLCHGGKRLRPFLTIAAYAVARHGTAMLAGDAEIGDRLPDAVRRLAIAIEAMHKASLIHDDIEDDDAVRYGRQTLHRAHGVGPAINIGDYLVGLGYRLVSGEAAALGGACVADILAALSAAHLDLCRGQGTELLWQRNLPATLRAADVLAVYALKTAPAFEVAIYTGLRTAERTEEMPRLRRLFTYLGEGYQILNDLDDWQEDAENKGTAGQDALAARPTLLRALALEAGGGPALDMIAAGDPASVASAVRALYRDLGVFARAEGLLARIRGRAQETADGVDFPPLRELMALLVRLVLRDTGGSHG